MNKILNIQSELYKQPLKTLIKLLQLICRIYIKFIKDAGFARAGGLAYTTLLSAVPFAAVVISLMNAFGALDTVQNQITDFIVQLLIPTKQAEVSTMLEQFLANSDKLGVVGLIFFILTSIMLLNTVNVNLNAVWGSRVKNNFLSKVTSYASIIIIGTLLLTASTTISSTMGIFSRAIENYAFINRLLLRLSPLLFEFLLIMLIIGLAPSGRVRFKSTLIAAIAGAIFWELAKYGFVNVSSWAIRVSVIYGTLAVIPIFLFWVYILWMIIIGSMELAWLHQHQYTITRGLDVSEMEPVEKLIFGFQIYLKIAENFEMGDKNLSIDELSALFSVSTADVDRITSIFVEKDLLLEVGEESDILVPARSLSGISTDVVLEALFGSFKPSTDHKLQAVRQVYRFYTQGTEALKKTSIEDLINSN